MSKAKIKRAIARCLPERQPVTETACELSEREYNRQRAEWIAAYKARRSAR